MWSEDAEHGWCCRKCNTLSPLLHLQLTSITFQNPDIVQEFFAFLERVRAIGNTFASFY